MTHILYVVPKPQRRLILNTKKIGFRVFRSTHSRQPSLVQQRTLTLPQDRPSHTVRIIAILNGQTWKVRGCESGLVQPPCVKDTVERVREEDVRVLPRSFSEATSRACCKGQSGRGASEHFLDIHNGVLQRVGGNIDWGGWWVAWKVVRALRYLSALSGAAVVVVWRPQVARISAHPLLAVSWHLGVFYSQLLVL